jgi:glycine/D-amino acid oxidase-like deaminating enzyme
MGKKVIIVGAGLFGSIAAALARRHGHDVTVIDNKEEHSASKASGCVLAPSWLTSLSSEQTQRAMEVLGSLYRVQDTALLNPTTGLTFKAKQVHPDDILVVPDIAAKVEAVGDGWAQYEGTKLKGTVLVAAGVWSESLVEMPKVRGLYGASVRVAGVRLEQPSITVYAPYRQAVAVNLPGNREVWFGDGTALIEATWAKEGGERIAKTLERFAKITGIKAARPKVRVGARPYVEDYKAGYFAQAGDRLWVSTGGAKNGTVLAAWQAWRFLEAL